MRQRLAIQYNLRIKSKKKSIMRAKNEFELLKILFLFSEIIFNYERYRVQLVLIIQLIDITENRSAALLAICYRHVKVTLLSNSNGDEQLRIILKIVYKYIKSYLGQKETFVFSVALYILYNNSSARSLTSITETNLIFSIYQISRVYCSVHILRCWH